MSKTPYFFNGESYSSMNEAWLSIAYLPRVISYSNFLVKRPKTTAGALKKLPKEKENINDILFQKTMSHKHKLSKYPFYAKILVNLIRNGGPKNLYEIEILSISIGKLQELDDEFNFMKILPTEDKPVIPSKNNVKSAKNIVEKFGKLKRLNKAQLNLLNAAKQEIINYNLRSCRNN